MSCSRDGLTFPVTIPSRPHHFCFPAGEARTQSGGATCPKTHRELGEGVSEAPHPGIPTCIY